MLQRPRDEAAIVGWQRRVGVRVRLERQQHILLRVRRHLGENVQHPVDRGKGHCVL
jgi:hypothetical protein